MRVEIRFFDMCRIIDGQIKKLNRVGAGSDGSVWLETALLGLSKEELASLQRKVGAQVVTDPDGRLFVDAQALVANAPCREEERGWLRIIDDLLDRMHPTNFRT